MALYLIRQAPDDYADSTGLSKYERSRMPGCTDVCQAYYDEGRGEYHTGLSDDEARVYGEKIHRDLSKSSDFWKTYSVSIYADEPPKFNTDLPVDVVAYKMLLANGYVAPSKEHLSRAEYRNTQYYAFTAEGEVKEEVRNSKQRDKALAKLVTIADNKDKLVLYGQYLEGLKYNEKMHEDTLYNQLRAYVMAKDLQNAKNFLAAFDKSAEEMQRKVIVDRALKARLITINKVGGKSGKNVYQYGQVTLGSKIEDVYANLAKVDFAPELMAIKEELEGK
jgi:hypothetical protein